MKRGRSEDGEPANGTHSADGTKRSRSEAPAAGSGAAATKSNRIAALKAKIAAEKKKMEEKKKTLQSEARPGSARPAFSSAVPAQDLSETLRQRKLEIEARLRGVTKGTATPSTSTTGGTSTPLPMAAIQRARESAMSRGTLTPLPPGMTDGVVTPMPLLLDNQGREVDMEGNVVSAKKQIVASSLINQRLEKQQMVEKRLRISVRPVDMSQSKYFDPRIGGSAPGRRERKPTLSFVTPGSYIRIGEEMRKAKQLEEYERKADIVKKEAKGGAKSAMASRVVRMLKDDPPPDVEWWDALLLGTPNRQVEESSAMEDTNGTTEENGDVAMEEGEEKKDKVLDMGDTTTFASTSTRKGRDRKPLSVIELTRNKSYEHSPYLVDKITHYIQHPPKIKALAPSVAVEPKPLFLTAKEKKKLRRHRRMEKQEELREMQMMGLLKPQEDKVKLSNMMRAKGKDHVLNPTQIEANVRAQQAERLSRHLQQNEERKLTPEQRKEKKMRKLRDSMGEATIGVALYKIDDVSSPLNRRKMDYMAKEGGLTGVLIIDASTTDPNERCNLVVVEGSPRALKKFKKLMLRRIDWNVKVLPQQRSANDTPLGTRPGQESMDTSDDTITDMEKEEGSNRCYLVWEGTVLRHNFKRFKFSKVEAQEDAVTLLDKRGVRQYWDMARNYRDVKDELID